MLLEIGSEGVTMKIGVGTKYQQTAFLALFSGPFWVRAGVRVRVRVRVRVGVGVRARVRVWGCGWVHDRTSIPPRNAS